MSTWKLIAYFAAWVAAAGMIGVVIAILVVELARLVGLAESGSTSYDLILNGTFLVVFIALVAVPFVFRARFNRYEPPPPKP